MKKLKLLSALLVMLLIGTGCDEKVSTAASQIKKEVGKIPASRKDFVQDCARLKQDSADYTFTGVNYKVKITLKERLGFEYGNLGFEISRTKRHFSAQCPEDSISSIESIEFILSENVVQIYPIDALLSQGKLTTKFDLTVMSRFWAQFKPGKTQMMFIYGGKLVIIVEP